MGGSSSILLVKVVVLPNIMVHCQWILEQFFLEEDGREGDVKIRRMVSTGRLGLKSSTYTSSMNSSLRSKKPEESRIVGYQNFVSFSANFQRLCIFKLHPTFAPSTLFNYWKDLTSFGPCHFLEDKHVIFGFARCPSSDGGSGHSITQWMKLN